MLEQKLRFKHSMITLQPKSRVETFYEEYKEAYFRLHKPSPSHISDYKKLTEEFEKYKKREDIKEI